MGTYLNIDDDPLGGRPSSLNVWAAGQNHDGHSRREDACLDGRRQPLWTT
jgi:hypothetical protein